MVLLLGNRNGDRAKWMVLAWRKEGRMNQKHCRGCPHLDFNEMTDEMYCKLRDHELIWLKWYKHRPDWCPLVTGAERRES